MKKRLFTLFFLGSITFQSVGNGLGLPRQWYDMVTRTHYIFLGYFNGANAQTACDMLVEFPSRFNLPAFEEKQIERIFASPLGVFLEEERIGIYDYKNQKWTSVAGKKMWLHPEGLAPSPQAFCRSANRANTTGEIQAYFHLGSCFGSNMYATICAAPY